jgi:hypothetical protein
LDDHDDAYNDLLNSYTFKATINIKHPPFLFKSMFKRVVCTYVRLQPSVRTLHAAAPSFFKAGTLTKDETVGEIAGGSFRIEPLRRYGEDASTMKERLICKP